MKRPARNSGFSLMEVLVAFAILSLSLLAIYRIHAASFRSLAAAGWKQQAVEIAKSKLAAVGIETPLVEGTTSGVTGGAYRWQVTISPYPGRGPLSYPDGQQALLLRIEVTVAPTNAETGNGAVVLTTARLRTTP